MCVHARARVCVCACACVRACVPERGIHVFAVLKVQFSVLFFYHAHMEIIG